MTNPQSLRFELVHPGQHRAKQRFERGFDALAGFHDFGVRERLVDYSGGHVGDAGNGEHPNSHVARGDYFSYGRHADEVRAHAAQIFNLRRSFVAGAEQAGIDAFVLRDAELGDFLAGDRAIFAGVGLRHVREADAEAVVVGADQRIHTLQVDVIADHDERALRVAEVDASSGVGEDDGANAHASEDADRERDFLRRISFVKMDAALHDGDGHVAGIADYHLAGVPNGG